MWRVDWNGYLEPKEDDPVDPRETSGKAIPVQPAHNKPVPSSPSRLARIVFSKVIAAAPAVALLCAVVAAEWYLLSLDVEKINSLVAAAQTYYIELCGAAAFACILAVIYVASLPRRVALVDFVCYRPPSHLEMPSWRAIGTAKALPVFDDYSVMFQEKVAERSGLGDRTSLPPSLINYPPTQSMKDARLEAEQVIFSTLDNLFKKTGVKPQDIGVLVVNCSLFCPTPSLSAMIVNKYKMREDVQAYNLGGMGCSAGLIAVKLARDLLQVHDRYAIVVSTENITQNVYYGKRRSMQIPNCLFRLGAAAILLSNRPKDFGRAKYELTNLQRTHIGATDKYYRCVVQEEDDDGVVGVYLSKDLMQVAGHALRANITQLGPHVLPISEQLIFAVSLLARLVLRLKIPAYVPDFRLAFEHFCIHAGGRGVLDEIEKALSLTPLDIEPSRMALYRFGNTSSSSVWYELSYIEAKGRMKQGDRVWQIVFGSGFKCNSAVWRALKNINAKEHVGPWEDCVEELPVELPAITA